MADLTKKDIKQLLGEQTKELARDLKDYTDKKLSAQTKELKSYTDKRFSVLDIKIDDLAGMTARRFDEMEKRLDVREKVQKLELEMKQVREALSL